MNTYSGVLFLHAIPRASANDLEALLGELGIKRQPHEWNLQPLVLGCAKTEIQWSCNQDVAFELASRLSQIAAIRFELTTAQTKHQIGQRWAFTPSLGLFCALIDEAGNLLVNENQLRNVLYGSGNDLLKTQAAMRRILGTAWDDELERYREQKYQAVSGGLLAGMG